MSKADFGRLYNRGANNTRFFVGEDEPENPIENDVWINPTNYGTYYIRKAATESVTSSTALQNDDHFVVSLDAGKVYEIELELAVSGAAAGDFKCDWTVTGGVAQLTTRCCQGPQINSTDATATMIRSSRHNLTTAVSYGTDGSTAAYIKERFLVETSGGAGTLQLRWAQQASSGTATTVTTSSYMLVRAVGSNLADAIKYYTGSAWAPVVK